MKISALDHLVLTVADIDRTIAFYSELNLNRYSVGSPCRTICTVCGSPPCPDFC
ncbi:conserved domain protein [Neisseria meningitidis H44/76]|uniref:hypothetical protein n=1 Tax=Neisseria meningitidis TaxID=487 RepID=UPI0001FC0661|nr:hypothetical protein [Neisseria meningitidis]ADY96363.1 conserved domain protein [Neisseria meningitidis H44/76]EGC62050.1 hypothetical protein NMBCU385_1928 [Neisseria meningitidis CU385]MBH5544500.1 hypothetical protein [Neisseria meningitidis]MBH6252192.1 hypothetical protein [Neisseria meningitidis]